MSTGPVPDNRASSPGPRNTRTGETPDVIARERRETPTNVFYFGNQRVTTKVFMMVPDGLDAVSVDVVDYMWEGRP